MPSVADMPRGQAGTRKTSCGPRLSLSEPWDEVRTRIEGVVDAGWSYLTVSWPSEGKARLDEFIDKVMPDYTECVGRLPCVYGGDSRLLSRSPLRSSAGCAWTEAGT
jgi:hypothetical protein